MADQIKALFLAALDIPTDRRSAYLDRACGGDAEVRRRVEALLRAHEGTDALLDLPAWRPRPEQEGPATLPGADPASAATQVDRAGRVHLLGEIARGGMGVVLRGHDPELQRELAVKVILPAHRRNPELLRRFVGEARLAGQLQHPGIMPVYDVGQLADGRPFFAMKLIQGRTLAELLAERGDPGHDLPRFLRYFEAVCQAVGYAHARGVIHRDLKPANVMVGAFGEVQVMDWGLAKRLGESPEGRVEFTPPPSDPGSATLIPAALTRPGGVVGTPGYLAPEQARGQPGDQRADVFGLGAILCEILTGAPPFRIGGLDDFLAQARQGDLTDALEGLDRCGADAELVRLAKDCLLVEPAGRPADGSAVAARLAEYLAGVQERLRRAEVGLARAEGERTRRRLAVGLAATVLALATLGGGTLLLVQHYQAEQAREQARRQQAGESALARAADLRQQGRWAEALAMLQQARRPLDERDAQVSREVTQAVVELKLVGRLEEVRLRAATWTGRSFAWARADREYESEFRAAGLGGPDEPAEAVAERIRASGVRAALVAALDAWAMSTTDHRRRDWVRAVARSADQGGEWARRLRANWADLAALKVLAHEAPLERLSPHLLDALAGALGNSREAVPFLRKAQARYPGDFWLTFSLADRLAVEEKHAEAAGFYRAALAVRPGTPAVLVNLGSRLKDQGELDEACDCYRRAIVIDPGFVYAHSNLGIALASKGKVDEAIACFRKAIELDPTFQEAHFNLGLTFQGKGDPDAAIACYKKALDLDPKYAPAHTNLGAVQKDRGQLDAAIACYHRAITLDPKFAPAHNNLGNALAARGKLEEAIACFKKAIALDPRFTLAHNNLGIALQARGKVEESIACFRQALALDPRYAPAHTHLGIALAAKGQQDEAIACFRQALALDPGLAGAYHNLGLALAGKGQLDEAIACLRQAVEMNPNFAEAHCNLGHALKDRGDFALALVSYRRGHELGSKREGWPHPSPAWVRQCQELVEREKKLLAVLVGKAQAAGARELTEYAALAAWTRRHAAAARLWGEAFAAEAKLADDLKAGHRYQAATAAARAAAGQGRDAGTLEDAQKAGLRKRALDWLKADLAARANQPASERAALLRRWLTDEALAGLRGEPALQALPRAERAAWSDFWSEVNKHLRTRLR
jgi:tetratricopeptide (TPR) repeat protein